MTTTAHADLEALHRHLDEYPDDQRVRRDLADHLDERGDPAGEALRWLAESGKWPERVRDNIWDWWCRSPLTADAHRVPLILYEGCHQLLFSTFSTRRAAEEAFAQVFQAARAAGWDPHGAA
jgi:hypothetical protein